MTTPANADSVHMMLEDKYRHIVHNDLRYKKALRKTDSDII